MVAKDKKKQHYVPQCYLEKWQTHDKYQVYVYDKLNKKSFPVSIKDVAQEHFFYDISFSEELSDRIIKQYNLNKFDVEHLDDDQIIENWLSKRIEGDFKRIIDSIISRVESMNNWEIHNCFFITRENKTYLSFHLTIQLLRVKAIRERLVDISDCVEQMMKEMGISQKVIDSNVVNKEDLSFLHAQMFTDCDEIFNFSQCFNALKWILLKNTTNQPFFTSDNPIARRAHIKHPFVSMAGLNSRGVEVCFPLSPEFMLLMFDGEYHKYIKTDERNIDVIDNIEMVKHYNSLFVSNSERFVYSKNNDFSIIYEVLAKNPTAYQKTKSELFWGGKTFTPRKRK